MKLLHIADLHAGKRLYERVNRNEDLSYALEQVVRICKEEDVELLLIAGDVFDKKSPDFESQGMVLEFLAELNSMRLHTLLIAGNHDSYDFMKIYKNLRKLANIHVFDRPTKHISETIFEYKDLKVACLPYPDERVITHLHEEKERSYAEKVAKYMKALAQEVKDARYRILLSHLMLDKALITGSELPSTVGPYYAVRVDTIPEEFHYAALGHVHRNQRVEGAVPKVYYSGSLYQIDFSERGMDKFVNLVVLENGLVRVIPLVLSLKRQLVDIKLGEEEDIERALAPFADKDVLVRVQMRVSMKDTSYNLKKELVHRILGDKLAKLEIEPVDGGELAKTEGEEFNLLWLYGEFHKQRYGSEPTKELAELFVKLMDRVSHEAGQA
ncbi:MAG: exonuclease subunit SbcD [Aquificaceae bacterium]|nr:exonuclease subunit SbcD [Aquificaceae bacterium]MCX8164683.1 exonuclease subunit SbcD [Aquificaceae bacterium]